MTAPGFQVLNWKPVGVVDAVDGTNAPPGAMSALTNLVPDPSTNSVFVPRPAAVQLTASIATTGAITVFLILGDWLYGMVTAGAYDVPFAYDIATQTLVYPVSGAVPGSNCPLAQPTVGDWVPPTMDTVGIYVLVTHPGFTGPGNGYFGYFNVTTPSAPTWTSGNTTIFPLIAPPTAVSVFTGRAYYAVGNAVQASDPFLPLQQTNASQVLTCGDSTNIVAMKGLPLNNTTGGIIQALIIFKANGDIYEVTGDFTGIPFAISLNTLNVAVLTQAPNAIVSSPAGLVFVASDGVRIIDFNSNVSDPIGENGTGVLVPFQSATAPSRMVAAFNMNTLRIAVRQSAVNASQTVEYWYHFSKQAWTGPHPLPTIFMQPYKNTFICSMLPVGS